MSTANARRGRFNWPLALALVLGLGVIGGSLYTFRKWRRTSGAKAARVTGMKAYESHDWELAARDLGRCVAVFRDDVPALLKYADAQLRIRPQKRGHIQQAIGSYNQILRYNPTDKEACERLSQLYLRMGMPGEAEMILRRRLEAGEDVDSKHLLAMALSGQKKFKEAAKILEGIIKDYPDRISAHEMLALLMRQRPEELPGSPLEILRKALTRNAKSAEAHIALGYYLERFGEAANARQEAKTLYDKAAGLDLSRTPSRVRLAERLLSMGDIAGAEKQLEAASKAEPDNIMIWMTWSNLVRQLNSKEKAVLVARRGL
ncbi:MAG: tetratricopeptide repeat protein, partial [Alphaproteobacteria bacterium]